MYKNNTFIRKNLAERLAGSTSELVKMNSRKMGFYSVGPDMKHAEDTSQLKYIRTIDDNELPFDLNQNIVKYSQFYNTEFKTFQKYLEENEDLVCRNSSNPPFVCTNALKILSEQGTVHITTRLYRGAIYMRAVEVSDPFSAADIEKSEMCSSWYLKFEQFMQSDRSGKQDTEKLAFGIERFYIVSKTTIKSHTVLHSQSVSGVNGKETDIKLDNMDVFSVHTTRSSPTYRQKKNFGIFKTKELWINAKLLGIKDIYLGHRDENGILLSVTKTTLEKMVEIGKEYWNTQECYRQIDNILFNIKQIYKKKTLSSLQNNVYFIKKDIFLEENFFAEVPATEAKDFPKISFV